MSRPNPETASQKPARRAFLQTAVAAIAAGGVSDAYAQEKSKKSAPGSKKSANAEYDTQATGTRIFPGKWRPHYPWEHIAWVSPSWPSQDYIWMDFPEAIFTSQGLLYLSHINPSIPTVFHNLPEVPWKVLPNGVTFERVLPNGIGFGGSVTEGKGSTVDLELHIHNGSKEELTDISLQTCAFLRGIKEFAEYTSENKFVHTPDKGWISIVNASKHEKKDSRYGVGWRTRSHRPADLPVAVTLSNQAERLVAMTWKESTLSMVANGGHPCVHADPYFKDLEPDEKASIHGKLIFFEGKLENFDYTKFI